MRKYQRCKPIDNKNYGWYPLLGRMLRSRAANEDHSWSLPCFRDPQTRILALWRLWPVFRVCIFARLYGRQVTCVSHWSRFNPLLIWLCFCNLLRRVITRIIRPWRDNVYQTLDSSSHQTPPTKCALVVRALVWYKAARLLKVACLRGIGTMYYCQIWFLRTKRLLDSENHEMVRHSPVILLIFADYEVSFREISLSEQSTLCCIML